jgi:hypothetical protein
MRQLITADMIRDIQDTEANQVNAIVYRDGQLTTEWLHTQNAYGVIENGAAFIVLHSEYIGDIMTDGDDWNTANDEYETRTSLNDQGIRILLHELNDTDANGNPAWYGRMDEETSEWKRMADLNA